MKQNKEVWYPNYFVLLLILSSSPGKKPDHPCKIGATTQRVAKLVE